MRNTSRNTRGELCSGRTASKTKKDGEQYSQEQGASPSQMAAAQFLDTISKLPGMAGETSGAISAYTQVKMTEAPRLLRLPKEGYPEIWIRIPPPKSWNNLEDPVVLLERNFYGHLHWPAFFGKEYLKKKCNEMDGKNTNMEMSLRAQKARIIFIGL